MKKDGEKRKCIVSGKVLEKDFLLRFTVLPDGHLVPDFKKKLPGTGIYVTANRDMLSAAVAKNLFSKTLKQTVRIAPDFVQTIEQLLKKHGLDMVSLSRKAGILRTGYEKVSELVKKGRAAFILEATNAGSDGHNRILSLARGLEIFNIYTVEELDKALDKNNTVHIAFEKSEMAKTVEGEFRKISNFLNSTQITADTENKL